MSETNNVAVDGADDAMIKAIQKAQQESKELNLTNEILLERFGDKKSEISRFDNISMNLKVDDPGSLKIAETHLGTLIKHIKNIEEVRKVFKEPYLEAGRRIDSYAKKLSIPFENVKLRINQAISDYKNIQLAQARAEEERKRKEAEALLAKKNEEIERLNRIRQQVFARIYGGVYYLKSGERKSDAGCIDKKQCEALLVFLREKFPKPETFQYIKDDAIDLYTLSEKLISEHIVNLIESEDDIAEVRQLAKEKISNARIKAQVISEEVRNTQEEQVQKEFKKELRSVENEIKDAGKGLRTNILFTILDEAEVPVDMKEVSEKKVNSYIRNNREKILKALQENKQPIKGLTLYVEKTYVSR